MSARDQDCITSFAHAYYTFRVRIGFFCFSLISYFITLVAIGLAIVLCNLSTTLICFPFIGVVSVVVDLVVVLWSVVLVAGSREASWFLELGVNSRLLGSVVVVVLIPSWSSTASIVGSLSSIILSWTSIIGSWTSIIWPLSSIVWPLTSIILSWTSIVLFWTSIVWPLTFITWPLSSRSSATCRVTRTRPSLQSPVPHSSIWPWTRITSILSLSRISVTSGIWFPGSIFCAFGSGQIYLFQYFLKIKNHFTWWGLQLGRQTHRELQADPGNSIQELQDKLQSPVPRYQARARYTGARQSTCRPPDTGARCYARVRTRRYTCPRHTTRNNTRGNRDTWRAACHVVTHVQLVCLATEHKHIIQQNNFNNTCELQTSCKPGGGGW